MFVISLTIMPYNSLAKCLLAIIAPLGFAAFKALVSKGRVLPPRRQIKMNSKLRLPFSFSIVTEQTKK